MKGMDERKKLKFRMKMQKVVYDVMFEEDDQLRTLRTASSTATSLFDSVSNSPINRVQDVNTIFHPINEVLQTQQHYHHL